MNGRAVVDTVVFKGNKAFLATVNKPLDGDVSILQNGDKVLARISKKNLIFTSLVSRAPAVLAYLSSSKAGVCAKNLKTDATIFLKTRQKALRALPPHTIVSIKNNTIDSVLGHISQPSVDEKIILAHLPHSTHCTDMAYEKNAHHLRHSVSSAYSHRVDLSALPFCSIDPSDAKDFDDAIYYNHKSSELFVAIADVSEFVTPFGDIDQAARLRGFSLYLPHKCLPMLPHALSHDMCSLQPFKKRLALVWRFRLHRDDAHVLDKECMLAVIESKARLSYDDVESFLDDYDSSNPIQAMLVDLFTQISKMRRRRLNKGYDFHTTEYRLELDSDFMLCCVHAIKENRAHNIVEECMLQANLATAMLLQEHFAHAIYRIHQYPVLENLKHLHHKLYIRGYQMDSIFSCEKLHDSISSIQKQADIKKEREYIDRLIIQAQSLAHYSCFPSAHFGLGFSIYTHFTSPIRRYVDLCVHRLVKSILEHKNTNPHVGTMESLCIQSNECERMINLAETAYKDRVYARCASLHLNKILEAMLLLPSTSRLPAVLQLYGLLNGARMFVRYCNEPILTHLYVRIHSVDLLKAHIWGVVV